MAKVIFKPDSVIIARLGLEPNGKVQRYFQNTCYRHMNKYVPYNDGNLRKNVDLSNPKMIVYESPYAKYQFYGKKMIMPGYNKSAFYSPEYGFWSKKNLKKELTNDDLVYHTAGTGSHWDKKMWSAEGKKVIKKVEEFIKKGG